MTMPRWQKKNLLKFWEAQERAQGYKLEGPILVCFYFLLFGFFTTICVLVREKKDVNLGRWGNKEDLEGVGGKL